MIITKSFPRLLSAILLAFAAASNTFAQDALEARLKRLEQEYTENLKNAETLQKQNEKLFQLLNTAETAIAPSDRLPLAPDEVRSIVGAYLQQKEAEEKKTDAADAPYKIGSNLRMSASWKNGLFLTTPHNDFTMHIGGWFMYDNVFWTESSKMRLPQGKAGPQPGIGSGAAPGGVGDLEDGAFFRRIRLQMNGTFWENFEYNLTFSFENNQFSSLGEDEFWVGMTNIPVLGTARIGHVKNAVGLEGNWTASSKAMTFMEQSAYAEAIELNEYDVAGLWLGNNYFDQRATWSATIFRPDFNSTTSAFFGDGQWGAQGRLTALPIYCDDGRHLLHLGLSGGWRAGTNNFTSSPLKGFQLRARPELRDDVVAASASGTQLIPNGDSARMIDTGVIVAPNDFLTGTEFLYILGPFSLQAEYGLNFVDNAQGFLTSAGAFVPLKNAQNYTFDGGYVQVAYTLTGENRSYEKRLGRLDSFYLGRRGPFTNAWLVRDEDGRLNWGLGAWEIAARYSHVDLNDGSGTSRVQGGIMDGLTLALNWYLSDNLKIAVNYVYNHRYDVPATTVPGSTQGLGMRVQFIY
jgi:phosphate-selective porin OprO/OprP